MRGRSSGPLSTSVILFLLVVVACQSAPVIVVAEADLSDMRLAASNEWLELYINDLTAAVAVREVKTGHVWHTNPPNWEREETVARGDAKQTLGAQIVLTYYQPGDVEVRLNSYKDSVLFEQHEITPIPQGIRVTYLLGREYGERAMVPNFISRSRVDEIRSSLADSGKLSSFDSRVLRNYTLVKMVPLEPGETPLGIASVDVAELFSGHKLVPVEATINDTRMRELARSVVLTVLDGRMDLEGFNDLKREHFLPLMDKEFYVYTPWTPQFMLDTIEAELKEIGYSIEQRTLDCEEFDIDPPLRNLETFVVPVEYVLEEDTLLVRISVDEVEYPRDVVDVRGSYGPRGGLVTFPLCSIRLLPYFGAVGSTGSGYIFVPDGSGGLIDLNNGRVGDNGYASRVYGRDYGVALLRESANESASIRMPVYGLKEGDKAFLAIIEDGASLATVYAEIAGRVSSYNTVGPAFQVIERAWAKLSGDPSLTRSGQWQAVDQVAIYQKEMYRGDIRLRYCFLSDSDADYVGMARHYQGYLLDRGMLKRRVDGSDVPLFVELIGGVEIRRSVLGLPVNVLEPLTTYAQVRDIVDAILEAGVRSLKLRYTGWLAGGVEHAFPDRVRLERALGDGWIDVKVGGLSRLREVSCMPQLLSWLSPGNKRRSKKQVQVRPRAREIVAKTQSVIWSLVRAGLIVGVGFIIVYPLLIKISSSLMSPDDLFDNVVKWVPRRPTLQNYVMAFESMDYPRALLNSLVLVTVVSVLQLASCTLVGYSLARYEYPGRRLISALAIFTLVVPPQLVLIPTYLNFRFFTLFGLIPGEGINLLGSFWPFVLTSSTGSGLRNGIFIFSMRQFFKNMPRQLQEAAYVDGASPFKTFLSVMLPNAGPALTTVFLFSFVWQWNDIFYTSIFTGGASIPLMPFAIENINRYAREMYIERYGIVPAGQQLSLFRNAGALMFIAPVLILYGSMQRHFVESIERTGLVG